MPTSLDVATQADKFSDERLRHLVDALDMGSGDAADAERQSKRRKVSTELLSLRTVTTQLKSLLGLEPTTNLADVKPALEYVNVFLLLDIGITIVTNNGRNKFQQLPETQLCRIISLLGYVCCAADDTVLIHGKKDGGRMRFDCRHCQPFQTSSQVPLCHDQTAKRAIYEIFTSLVEFPGFLELRKPRVTAMAAIRRVARHCTDPEFLDLELSVAAQWCLKSLQSSIRELRIAAGLVIVENIHRSYLTYL